MSDSVENEAQRKTKKEIAGDVSIMVDGVTSTLEAYVLDMVRLKDGEVRSHANQALMSLTQLRMHLKWVSAAEQCFEDDK